MFGYLLKPAAMLMAMVMAVTAAVCRCGMSSCVADAHSIASVQPERKQHCERGCDKQERDSHEGQAPERCDDCGRDKADLDRHAPGADPANDIHVFAPVADPLWIDAPADSARPIIGRELTTGPPIDVLRQSCILLI